MRLLSATPASDQPRVGGHTGDDPEWPARHICGDLGPAGTGDQFKYNKVTPADQERRYERREPMPPIDIQRLQTEGEHSCECRSEKQRFLHDGVASKISRG